MVPLRSEAKQSRRCAVNSPRVVIHPPSSNIDGGHPTSPSESSPASCCTPRLDRARPGDQAGLIVGSMVAKSAPAESPRSRRRRSELRELILRSAERAFTGIRRATTVEIAERAGSTGRSGGGTSRRRPTSSARRWRLRFSISSKVGSRAGKSQLAEPWPSEQLVRTFVAELYRDVRTHRDAVRLLLFGGIGAEELASGSTAIGALLAQVRPIFRQEHERRGP